MKIEKINDNQIRCTLTKADLEDRNIKLSELAYGSGKTKELFQDMMRQANDDFGFEVNDIPLMVEAIPLSPESIVLVITKVENPEETENHLAKFFSKELKEGLLAQLEEGNIDIEALTSMDRDPFEPEETSSEKEEDTLVYSIYIFDELSQIMKVAKLIAPTFKGDSSIYKSPFNGKFYLSLCMEGNDNKALNKICGILTEHGTKENPTYAKELYYIEHFEEIIAEKAIEKLGMC